MASIVIFYISFYVSHTLNNNIIYNIFQASGLLSLVNAEYNSLSQRENT